MIIDNIIKSVQRLGSRPVLPPGELVDLEILERKNRTVLIELAVQHGDIFKVREESRPQICVMGIERGKKLLSQHGGSLHPVNIDLTSLFSAGFMRLMAGDIHKHYRSVLITAVNDLDMSSAHADLDEIASKWLHRHHQTGSDPELAAQTFRDTLSRISTGFLIRLFFGAQPNSELFDRLTHQFHCLGPHGVVWNITDVQKREFRKICATLTGLVDSMKTPNKSSILDHVSLNGGLDETMLGNLIYMVEIGRYDMAGLFKWIARNAAVHTACAEKVAEQGDAKQAREYTQAFVRETLRMNQSERLVRQVTDEFQFEGFNFQKGWRVRICLWESHKDAAHFAEPFTFNPDRFLSAAPTGNTFSPFGLDHHQCPFSALSVSLGTQFLMPLLKNFKVFAVNDGASVRGPYHWEPPVDFSVKLERIEQ